MAENKETYALDTFGRIIPLTRQAMVNDDLGAFFDLTRRMGRAAAEFEAKFLVGLLASNPTMADGVAVFHANHGNLPGAGGAIAIATLGAAKEAMRLQKGLDKATPIDATPKFLIVPAKQETVAQQYLTQLQANQASNANPFGGQLELIVDPRLDVHSTTAWYLAADPMQIDTIEYSYLEEEQGVQLFVQTGFKIDGMEFKARLDFGAGILDFRGLYKNPGA
jgi:phage major head subunit gpT-like protein